VAGHPGRSHPRQSNGTEGAEQTKTCTDKMFPAELVRQHHEAPKGRVTIKVAAPKAPPPPASKNTDHETFYRKLVSCDNENENEGIATQS